MRINARRLVDVPLNEIWDSLTGSFTLVFDDGEMVVDDRSTIFSRYAWEFHRIYPNTPILMKHHLSSVLKGKRYSPGTHLKLLESVLWDVYDHICLTLIDEEQRLVLRTEMARHVYEIVNAIYNDMSEQLEEYVMSLDLTDFTQVLNTPEMQEMEQNLQPTAESIDAAYETISTLLRKKQELLPNPISQLIRSGLISEKQLHQCLGPRGFLTDSNSDVFPNPIMSGYIHGIRTIHDNMIESRSAAKAMMFAKAPLQQAEYFSRRLQFVAQAVERLHHTDCGSTKYLHWNVRGPETRDGEVVYGGDLRHIEGKYYMDDDGKLKMVKASDTHLIGRTIKMRSVLYCHHTDPSGICRKCFGGLSDSIPPSTNLGQMCATYVTQQSSQSVLSVKHLDGSATIDPVVLSIEDLKYLDVMPNGNSYRLSDDLKGKKVTLLLYPDQVKNLSDVLTVDDVKKLPISRVSEIKSVGLRVETDALIMAHEVQVFDKRRLASLTHQMLNHVKNVGWSYNDDGVVEINMDSFGFEEPIMALPMRTFNMSDHSQEIASLIESCVEDTEKRDNFTSPPSLLVDLFMLVNERLSVNLAILEVVLYSAMIVSAEDNDYALPKPWGKQGMGVMRRTMDNRNFAPRMAYERHAEVINNPMTYLLDNRFEHIFDGLLMPREVLAAGTREL